jgi:hypothetical protein
MICIFTENFLTLSFPKTEVVRAMNYVIDKGWVQYWGRSSVVFSHAENPLMTFIRQHLFSLKEAQNGRLLK